MKTPPLVVFFDGECVMCNCSVTWFARRDIAERLVFATNRGPSARVADEPADGDMGTVVVWDGSRRMVRSDAALMLLSALGGGWALLAYVARLCPRKIRDWIYDQIALRRYRLGANSACSLLSPYSLAE